MALQDVSGVDISAARSAGPSRHCAGGEVSLSEPIAWVCHLHRGDSCQIRMVGGKYFHAVRIKNLHSAAQMFNHNLGGQEEFMEALGNEHYLATIANITSPVTEGLYDCMERALLWLDKHAYRYRGETANDFIRKYMIFDKNQCITLVNKHRLRTAPAIKSAADVPTPHYSRVAFRCELLKILFPSIGSRTNISADIPQWAITRYGKLREAKRNDGAARRRMVRPTEHGPASAEHARPSLPTGQ